MPVFGILQEFAQQLPYSDFSAADFESGLQMWSIFASQPERSQQKHDGHPAQASGEGVGKIIWHARRTVNEDFNKKSCRQ